MNNDQKTIAFCGKPNVGKSALINALAGSHLRVGNWAGVTVEKYEAHVQWQDKKLHLVDLPGLRDFSCTSQDQSITSNYLFGPDIALCINVVEVSHLEDDLILTLRLRELLQGLKIPMLLALNYADELKRLNWEIDLQALQQQLGCPVVLVSARTKSGIEELKSCILEQSSSELDGAQSAYQAKGLSSPEILQNELSALLRDSQLNQKKVEDNLWFQLFRENKELLHLENVKDVLKKLSEKEQKSIEELFAKDVAHDPSRDSSHYSSLDPSHNSSMDPKPGSASNLEFLEMRFKQFKEQAKGVAEKCLHKVGQTRRISKSEKVDRLLLHPFVGPLLGLLAMLVVFSITFSFADPFIGFVDEFFQGFVKGQLGRITGSAPVWLASLINDGIIAGLGLILSFTPLMFILYVLIGIMEESGYMVRIAFMADRSMAHMGVSGRSLIPLFMGFGCNVPSIYATRSLESVSEKRITAFLAGFMSCGARMPVLGLFTATFLGPWAGFAVVCLYLFGVFVAFSISLILKRMHYFKHDGEAFIIDIPPYRWPLLPTLSKIAGFRTWSYVRRASTRILALLICLWVFTFFPAQGDVEKSYAASFAKWAQPVFEPLGFGNRWQLVGAMPTAIVAKEGALAALGQFMGSEEESSEPEEIPNFVSALQGQGLAFLDAIKTAFQFDIVGFMSGASETTIEADYGRGIIGSIRRLWEGDPLGSLRSLSFAIFILLVVPCIVVLGALRQEFGSKFTVAVIAVYSVVPYIASLLFFQIGRLLFS